MYFAVPLHFGRCNPRDGRRWRWPWYQQTPAGRRQDRRGYPWWRGPVTGWIRFSRWLSLSGIQRRERWMRKSTDLWFPMLYERFWNRFRFFFLLCTAVLCGINRDSFAKWFAGIEQSWNFGGGQLQPSRLYRCFQTILYCSSSEGIQHRRILTCEHSNFKNWIDFLCPCSP